MRYLGIFRRECIGRDKKSDSRTTKKHSITVVLPRTISSFGLGIHSMFNSHIVRESGGYDLRSHETKAPIFGLFETLELNVPCRYTKYKLRTSRMMVRLTYFLKQIAQSDYGSLWSSNVGSVTALDH